MLTHLLPFETVIHNYLNCCDSVTLTRQIFTAELFLTYSVTLQEDLHFKLFP